MDKKVLVTGAAGFIGFHLSNKLLSMGLEVVGLDNINDYYDQELKLSRLKELGLNTSAIEDNNCINGKQGFSFYKTDLQDRDTIDRIFKNEGFHYVVNLGGQAGVRYSLKNPHSYIDSNVMGFLNILEGCRNYSKLEHLVYASSSSVYGLNEKYPLSVHDNVDHPISLYAASKKANELMAHSYSHLYDIPTSGLRFFTVYGPWGRPDSAPFLFTKKILAGDTIDVYNNGDMQRDFTFVEDLVESISRLLPALPKGDPSFSGVHPAPDRSRAPYRIYNIGNNAPVQLMDFVKAIENITGKKATINFMPMQPGDVKSTYADVQSLIEQIHFTPGTSIMSGMEKFIAWYKQYYSVS